MLSTDDEWNRFCADPDNKNCLILVQISATWCKPCHQISPYVEKFAQDYALKSLKVVKIDADEAENNLFEFGVVDTLPTFRFVRDGCVLGTYVDSNPVKLSEQIEKFLK